MLFDLGCRGMHCDHHVHTIAARRKSAKHAHTVEKSGDDHRAMRYTLITRDSDFEIDSRRPLYAQFHTMNLNFLMFMPDVRIKRLCCANPVFTVPASAELREHSLYGTRKILSV